MPTHTPEPWIRNKYGSVVTATSPRPDDSMAASIDVVGFSLVGRSASGNETGVANTDRILSAVNACASLDDPEADIRRLCKEVIATKFITGENQQEFVYAIARRWLAAHPEKKETTREAE